MQPPVVEIRHVSKYFSKVIANNDVSFTVSKGEVVALLGENGAGKSTIMKVLYGLYSADEGEILIDGKNVRIKNPKDAMSHGIAMIQQHFSLVYPHTVTENIILGNVHGWIRLEEYDTRVKAIADSYGFDIPVTAKVGSLAVGVQQKVEILKALYLNARILIMDEPTAVLTPQESETLMQFIKDFASRGNSVIFITHKMKEVMEVADRIVVMKAGKVAGIVDRSNTDENELARMMMSSDLEPAVRDEDSSEGGEILSIEHASLADKSGLKLLDDVSFSVHAGEIFGIAGVSGNGQDELCEAICGAIRLSSGRISFMDRDITDDSVRERIDAGMGYVPVDRHRDGMIGAMTLAENMLLKKSYGGEWVHNGFIRNKELDSYTADKIKQYQIKATGPDDSAGNLSGGNQQKVVLAREIDAGKHLVVFNQPTRGLDVGAVERIHHSILNEKREGKAVILVSTELSEIFSLSDRIAIMYQGKIMGIYRNGELTTEEIGLLMAGVDYEKAQ